MANLIIKPASGSDSLILQDGAGAAVVTVSTNNVLYSKGVQETAPAANVASGTTIAVDLQTGNFFTADLQNASGTVASQVDAYNGDYFNDNIYTRSLYEEYPVKYVDKFERKFSKYLVLAMTFLWAWSLKIFLWSKMFNVTLSLIIAKASAVNG